MALHPPAASAGANVLTPAECRLVEEVLDGSFLDELPARLIWDKAHDSDRLDEILEKAYGIELIAPNRGRRSKTDAHSDAKREDGRWSGSSPGCTTSADSSPDGNTTSRTFSASSTSPACRCYSGIYETASSSIAFYLGCASPHVPQGTDPVENPSILRWNQFNQPVAQQHAGSS
jgi:hypothetical protein